MMYKFFTIPKQSFHVLNFTSTLHITNICTFYSLNFQNRPVTCNSFGENYRLLILTSSFVHHAYQNGQKRTNMNWVRRPCKISKLWHSQVKSAGVTARLSYKAKLYSAAFCCICEWKLKFVNVEKIWAHWRTWSLNSEVEFGKMH